MSKRHLTLLTNTIHGMTNLSEQEQNLMKLVLQVKKLYLWRMLQVQVWLLQVLQYTIIQHYKASQVYMSKAIPCMMLRIQIGVSGNRWNSKCKKIGTDFQKNIMPVLRETCKTRGINYIFTIFFFGWQHMWIYC